MKEQLTLGRGSSAAPDVAVFSGQHGAGFFRTPAQRLPKTMRVSVGAIQWRICRKYDRLGLQELWQAKHVSFMADATLLGKLEQMVWMVVVRTPSGTSVAFCLSPQRSSGEKTEPLPFASDQLVNRSRPPLAALETCPSPATSEVAARCPFLGPKIFELFLALVFTFHAFLSVS